LVADFRAKQKRRPMVAGETMTIDVKSKTHDNPLGCNADARCDFDDPEASPRAQHAAACVL
jgi:hypothetical protein